MFHKYKPNVSRLRSFGSTAYVHVPKEKRTKLDPKSEVGIMVGYSDNAKAWCIAFQDNAHIHVAERDSVVFYETRLGPLSICRLPAYTPTVEQNLDDGDDDISIDVGNMGEISEPQVLGNVAQN